jgi:hypothetical protein
LTNQTSPHYNLKLQLLQNLSRTMGTPDSYDSYDSQYRMEKIMSDGLASGLTEDEIRKTQLINYKLAAHREESLKMALTKACRVTLKSWEAGIIQQEWTFGKFSLLFLTVYEITYHEITCHSVKYSHNY